MTYPAYTQSCTSKLMNICTYACQDKHLQPVYTHICVHTYIHTHNIYIHTCIYVQGFINRFYIQTKNVYTHQVGSYACVYLCKHTCRHVFMHVCQRFCILQHVTHLYACANESMQYKHLFMYRLGSLEFRLRVVKFSYMEVHTIGNRRRFHVEGFGQRAQVWGAARVRL